MDLLIFGRGERKGGMGELVCQCCTCIYNRDVDSQALVFREWKVIYNQQAWEVRSSRGVQSTRLQGLITASDAVEL